MIQIPVHTNNHYHEYINSVPQGYTEDNICEKLDIKPTSTNKKALLNIFDGTVEITNKSHGLEHIKILGFKEGYSRIEGDPELILKLFAKVLPDGTKRYFVQTGLFAGVVIYGNIQFNIVSKYGETFLKRMLNFASDIYVDDDKTFAEKSNEHNEFQNILAHLFIQSLERAAVLGLPQSYQNSLYRGTKVRGKIDLNTYLKRDIPFQGKITSQLREQMYAQEIVDVLYTACRVLERNFGKDLIKKVFGVYHLLKEHYSGALPTFQTIERALQRKELYNPMYSRFKKVLKYAELIIKDQDLSLSVQESDLTTCGYLFDISQLFEVYLEKVLSRRFTEWSITGQEQLHVYTGKFYGRQMLPDLVLKHNISGKVIVLDAKYKAMDFKKHDLDREDFYQIHSYMKYYQPDVILGGLIYPLNKDLVQNKAHAQHVFDNEFYGSHFIVDGIYVNSNMALDEIVLHEEEFLSRLGSKVNEELINSQTEKSLL